MAKRYSDKMVIEEYTGFKLLLLLDYLEFCSQQGEIILTIYTGNPLHGENSVAQW